MCDGSALNYEGKLNSPITEREKRPPETLRGRILPGICLPEQGTQDGILGEMLQHAGCQRGSGGRAEEKHRLGTGEYSDQHQRDFNLLGPFTPAELAAGDSPSALKSRDGWGCFTVEMMQFGNGILPARSYAGPAPHCLLFRA